MSPRFLYLLLSILLVFSIVISVLYIICRKKKKDMVASSVNNNLSWVLYQLASSSICKDGSFIPPQDPFMGRLIAYPFSMEEKNGTYYGTMSNNTKISLDNSNVIFTHGDGKSLSYPIKWMGSIATYENKQHKFAIGHLNVWKTNQGLEDFDLVLKH